MEEPYHRKGLVLILVVIKLFLSKLSIIYDIFNLGN